MQAGNRVIGFIGGGNMSSAIIRGLLEAGHAPGKIRVSDPDPARLQDLRTLHPELVTGTDNTAVAGAAELLVLAVKPQVMAEVASALAPAIGKGNEAVFSIAAGVTLASLAGWLGPRVSLVRAMPNQPALIGAGISGLVAGPGLDDRRRQLAQYVAQAVGQVVWLDDEALLDAVTAVSGSGPAYFYLLMELLERGGIELGLPRELAATLVAATALGAVRTVTETGQRPADLRTGVTSPGGTTAAALTIFEQADLGGIVRRALTAARDRSVELGRNDTR